MAQLIPGQLAKIDREDRLSIPMEILRNITWWSGEPIRVLAEFRDRGLVRVHGAAARAIIDGLDRDLQQETSESAHIARAVLIDRYRELALYKDGRLRLIKEVCPWLGFRWGEQAELYVQPLGHVLEIMSQDYRLHRLTQPRTDSLPWQFEF
jgi:hypothetical protein